MNIKTHSSNEKERFVRIEEDEKKELFAEATSENPHVPFFNGFNRGIGFWGRVFSLISA